MNPKLGFTYPHLKDVNAVIPVGGIDRKEALIRTKDMLGKALKALVRPCSTLFGAK